MTTARIALVVFLGAAVVATALIVGARYGALLLVGLGLGLTLEGLRFGFAGPWRAFILRREPAGIAAQLLAIAGVALVAFPLLAARPDELVGAHAPIGIAMLGGAFVFGVSMQLVLGCGSGTLVNAGSGNAVALVALPFFAIGSFAGAYHLDWWIDLGTAPTLTTAGNADRPRWGRRDCSWLGIAGEPPDPQEALDRRRRCCRARDSQPRHFRPTVGGRLRARALGGKGNSVFRRGSVGVSILVGARQC
jgi:uncharacterized membrane protein YedE/YeeE